MVPVIAVVPVFVAVKEGTLPLPEAPSPIAVLLLVQLKVAPEGILVKFVAGTVAPLQTVIFDGTITVVVG